MSRNRLHKILPLLLCCAIALLSCNSKPPETTAQPEIAHSRAPALTPEQAKSKQTNPALSKLYQDCRIDGISFNDQGLPATIWGTLTFGSHSTEPMDLLIDFLTRHRDLWRMKDPISEFRVVRISAPDKFRETYTVNLQQQYEGVDVFHGILNATFDSSLLLTSVSAHYFPVDSLDATPAIDSTRAKEIAAELEQRTVDQCNYLPPELTVYPNYDQFLLCWKVQLAYDNYSWLYFIDAHTGVEVHRVNTIVTSATE